MRKRRKQESTPDEAVESVATTPVAQEVPGLSLRPNGPWDVSEHPLTEGDESRADVGSLSVRGREDVEIRLQVDEASNQVVSVVLVAEDGAAELKVFAAPRNESIWDDVRRHLASDATRRGGTASEVEGPYGPGLSLSVPVVTPEGQAATQASLVWGISGPRWLLMASLFGRPAATPDPDGALEQALADVVVVRGNEPMAPGDALPLRLPAGAHRA